MIWIVISVIPLIKGFNAKNKQQIVYADVSSVAKPVFIHVPKAENGLGIIENKRFDSEGDEPEPKGFKKNPILFDQAELNDFIRDLNLSKDKAEFLGSQLKEKKDMATFFSDEDALIYCNDVNKLMKVFGHKHIVSEWRFFID